MQKNGKLHHITLLSLMIGTAVVFGFFYFVFMFPKNAIPQQLGQMIAPEEHTAIVPVVAATHSLNTVKSNQWYSTANIFPSEPIYAFPAAFKVTESGLGFSLPKVKSTEKTIFAPYDEDFTIGFATPMAKSAIASVGDWSVGMKLLTKNNESLQFTLAHGIPYTVITPSGQNIVFKTKGAFTLSEGSLKKETTEGAVNAESFMLKANDNYYAIAFDKTYPVKVTKNTIELPNAKSIFVGMLDNPSHFEEFLQSKDAAVTGTAVAYSASGNDLVSEFSVTTQTGTPLIALLPHHTDFLNDSAEVIGSYTTLRGKMDLIRANSFKTEIPLTIPPSTFPALTTNQSIVKVQLQKDIAAFMKETVPESRNYFLGTWFGTADRMLLMAEALKMDTEKKKLLAYVTPIFKESLNYYSYDAKQTSLIAKKPEFGNEKLNDHHFHYGYYIQTAAILSRMNPSLLPQLRPTIDEMVGDIATIDRSSSKFPFLRNYDVYEGHSWADGVGNAPDGNNQESTSESINAWYSLYLWSDVIEDENLRTYVLAMYTTEKEAAKYYWFNTKNIYEEPYKHRIASIVWGGKVDFATWFSPKANMIYGIQLLPFTPASDYLGELPDFASYEKDILASGGGYTDEWADLLLMWKSYYEPVAIKDVPKDLKSNDRNPLSAVLYFISMNAK